MDANDLRALADALEPMARAPRFEDFDVPGFCAWVRACADAKPVGYVTANGLRMLRQDDATVLLYPHDYLIRPDQVAVYTHPVPSAPQAEPKREDRPVRDLLAIIHCDGGHHTEAVGLDQSIKDAQAAVCELKRELAMGKREPLSDDWIIDTANAINAALPFDTDEQAGLLQIARAVERAHGISGGSDAE